MGAGTEENRSIYQPACSETNRERRERENDNCIYIQHGVIGSSALGTHFCYIRADVTPFNETRTKNMLSTVSALTDIFTDVSPCFL